MKFWESCYVLRHLKRALSVSETCTGLCAYRRIAQLAEMPYEVVNAYEIDHRYSRYYQQTSTRDRSCLMRVRCSKDADITTLSLNGLDNSEKFMAGPPCTPWSLQGDRQGVLDSRSAPYETCIDMIIELAQRGCLLMFVLENSPELFGTPFLANMLEKLDACIPFFTVDVKVLELNDLWPSKRHRLYVRGMRKDCVVEQIPDPIATLGQVAGAHAVFLSTRRASVLQPIS